MKLQRISQSQAPNHSRQRSGFGERVFGGLKLETFLGVGTWSLGFCPLAVRDRIGRKIPGTQGFTLIELMVVLVLIGIMSAMIIPEMKGTFEEALLRSTGRELVNAFGLAYSQAVTVNQLHRVRLDLKSGRYFVERTVREGERGRGFVTVRDLRGGEGTLDTRISIKIRRPDEAPSGARDQEPTFVSGDDLRSRNRDEVIAFYPDGTADSGEFVLRDREGFGLSLRINPTTAQVRIVELERE